MTRVLTALVALLPCLAYPQVSGPFGINMGDSPEDPKFENFEEINPTGPGMIAFMGSSPPAPHSSFSTYAIQYHPDQGACWGQARTEYNENDRFGITIRNDMESVVEQISRRYGSPQKTDRLMPGALFDEAEDWSRALSRNERFYFYEWDESQLSQVGNGVSSMIFLAQGTGLDRTRAVLEWQFENYTACKALADSLDSEAF